METVESLNSGYKNTEKTKSVGGCVLPLGRVLGIIGGLCLIQSGSVGGGALPYKNLEDEINHPTFVGAETLVCTW